MSLRAKGYKVAQTHFKYLNPLPQNTAEILSKYKKVVVAEQNMGQACRLSAYEGRQLYSGTVQPGEGSAFRSGRVSQRI